MRPMEVGVLLFDPSLSYSFAKSNRIGEEELEAARRLRDALAQIDGYRFTFFDDHERLIDALRESPIDLALNFCDVGFRNDWDLVIHIPALLDMLGIRYTGSDSASMIMASDKPAACALARDLDVPVPDETFIDVTTEPLTLPPRYPALIKPCIGGGSWGITADSVVRDPAQTRHHLRRLSEEQGISLVVAQELLTGEEYTVGVLERPDGGLEVLPPMAVDYSELAADLPALFTYDAKFEPGSPYYGQVKHRRAELDEARREALGEYSRRLFRRLGCRDYARFDFRCDGDGEVKFLDANPNPTWYHDSRLAMMAGWAGYDYPALIERILESARSR